MGDQQRILGLDVGIASCGWGAIELNSNGGSVIAAGVRCFDAPLVDKTGEPKSAQRRVARGQRRVIRRRRQRMNSIRKLLHRAGLLPDQGSDALAFALRHVSPPGSKPQITPWALRAAAHDRLLTADQFAVALGHIARHRGFRSNSKREAANNAADETSKMKKAMEQTREGLAKYRSFGEMLASDPKFAERKRNRDKDYSHTAKRSDLEDEVRLIFQAQRRLGNASATDELERQFIEISFSQRPLQDSEDKVGKCPFEPDQKRTAKRAPSFELFRFLQRLVNLRIAVGRAERALSPDEIAVVLKKFGQQKTYTYKTLRKDLDLDPNARFSALARSSEGLDIAARKGQSAFGTCVLREVLGDAPWRSLLKAPEKLDRVAEILTFREDLDSINKGLVEIGLDEIVLGQLMKTAREGAFTEFKGAAHISALAARNIMPGLRDGLVYSDACARAGYDHSARPAITLDQIGSPVTRRAFSEAIKQVRAVDREYGPFDAIHVELARDVGKSAEERAEITRGIEERNAEKDRRKKEASDLLDRTISDDELLRYELAKEQSWKCVYCDNAIAPVGFAANDTRWQVDHILPWSRFGDDSYFNKTLCCAKCNQDKRGRSPAEWFEADKSTQDWDTFVTRFENLKEMKGRKKRNLRLRDAATVEDKFKERNLTDTKWVSRLLADELKRMFPAPAGKRRVFTRPGAITSKLRRAWGLEGTKKENGERVSDDRHHAVDALVLAGTTESLLQRITQEMQKREHEGRADDIFHFYDQQPWTGFERDVIRAVHGANGAGGVFVSRAERRRARGKAHDATIRQIAERDDAKLVFERKSIDKLSEQDLTRIKDPERNHKLVTALRAWLDEGRPKDRPPTWKYRNGDGFCEEPIRKIRLVSKAKPAIMLRGGTVDRSEMVRVDVFETSDPKSRARYLFVPIYSHQVIGEAAPDLAFTLRKPYDSWRQIGEEDRFLFSLNKLCFIEIESGKDLLTSGYFRTLDSNDGRISITPHESNSEEGEVRISPTTIRKMAKFTVDRLGRKFEVKRELRTWRGKVCT